MGEEQGWREGFRGSPSLSGAPPPGASARPSLLYSTHLWGGASSGPLLLSKSPGANRFHAPPYTTLDGLRASLIPRRGASPGL